MTFLRILLVSLCGVLLIACSNATKDRALLLGASHTGPSLKVPLGSGLSTSQIKSQYPAPAIDLSQAKSTPSLVPPGSNIQKLRHDLNKKK